MNGVVAAQMVSAVMGTHIAATGASVTVTLNRNVVTAPQKIARAVRIMAVAATLDSAGLALRSAIVVRMKAVALTSRRPARQVRTL